MLKMKKSLIIVLLIVFWSLLFGSDRIPLDNEDFPDWFTQLPKSENKIFAVGISDPGFSKEVAAFQAYYRARIIISLLFNTKVKSMSKDYISEDSALTGDTQIVVESSSVLIPDIFVLKEKEKQLDCGSTFVLVSIDLDNFNLIQNSIQNSERDILYKGFIREETKQASSEVTFFYSLEVDKDIIFNYDSDMPNHSSAVESNRRDYIYPDWFLQYSDSEEFIYKTSSVEMYKTNYNLFASYTIALCCNLEEMSEYADSNVDGYEKQLVSQANTDNEEDIVINIKTQIYNVISNSELKNIQLDRVSIVSEDDPKLILMISILRDLLNEE